MNVTPDSSSIHLSCTPRRASATSRSQTGTKVVHLAGQVALDQQFGIVGGDDLGEQTKAAMRNVEMALKAAGASWDDVVRRTIYTLHPTEYAAITAAIDEVTGGADHPAQTIVGITGLAVDGLLIEIECTAIVAD